MKDIQTDKLLLVAKTENLDSIKQCYSAFGWKCIEEKEDNEYGDILHLTYERPHKIPKKETIQLLQIRTENLINKLAKLRKNKAQNTATIGLILGFLGLGLIFGGFFIMLASSLYKYLFAGLGFALGVGILISSIFICRKIYKREIADFRKKEQEILQSITKNCEKAKGILENEQT